MSCSWLIKIRRFTSSFSASIPIKKLGSWCIQNFPTFGHQTICRHLAKWYKMYYTALFNYLTIFPGLKSATKTWESAESTIVFTLVSWAAETANSAAQRFTFQNGWKNPWCFTAGNMDVWVTFLAFSSMMKPFNFSFQEIDEILDRQLAKTKGSSRPKASCLSRNAEHLQVDVIVCHCAHCHYTFNDIIFAILTPGGFIIVISTWPRKAPRHRWSERTWALVRGRFQIS